MEYSIVAAGSQWAHSDVATGVLPFQTVDISEGFEDIAHFHADAASVFDVQSIGNAEGLTLLDTFYRFQDYQEVSFFLRLRPFLIDLLIEARLEILQLIPSASQLVLEVVRDPEGDSTGRLFLYIQAPVTVEDAYGLMQALDARWWLSAARRAHCQLTIDVDYTACLAGATFSAWQGSWGLTLTRQASAPPLVAHIMPPFTLLGRG